MPYSFQNKHHRKVLAVSSGPGHGRATGDGNSQAGRARQVPAAALLVVSRLADPTRTAPVKELFSAGSPGRTRIFVI